MVDYNNYPGRQTLYQSEYDCKKLNCEDKNVKDYVK